MPRHDFVWCQRLEVLLLPGRRRRLGLEACGYEEALCLRTGSRQRTLPWRSAARRDGEKGNSAEDAEG